MWFCHLFKHFNILINYNSIAMLCFAKSLQSCPTLCDPIDGSPPGFPVPGILQARTLEWVAISFSNAGKWQEKVKSLIRVWLLVTPRTAAYQAPPSMGFSRQEYWSGAIALCKLFVGLQILCRDSQNFSVAFPCTSKEHICAGCCHFSPSCIQAQLHYCGNVIKMSCHFYLNRKH